MAEIELEQAIESAAIAINNADILLISAGAGFSADSGLPVYKDIANFEVYRKMGLEYADICHPSWIDSDIDLFWGFWGKCYNDYMDASCHEGYTILRRWSTQNFGEKCFKYVCFDNPSEITIHSSFVATSNVDGLFHKSGWRQDLVFQIHGCALNFQCAVPCQWKIWSLENPDFRFEVDLETMMAPRTILRLPNNQTYNNHPKCIYCGGPARPNVLMFGDTSYVADTTGNGDFFTWRQNIKEVLRFKKNTNFVILEIGCGKRVPTLRSINNNLLTCTSLAESSTITLIRINPDYPGLDLLPHENQKLPIGCKHIGIRAQALPALKKIDEVIQKAKYARRDDSDMK